MKKKKMKMNRNKPEGFSSIVECDVLWQFSGVPLVFSLSNGNGNIDTNKQQKWRGCYSNEGCNEWMNELKTITKLDRWLCGNHLRTSEEHNKIKITNKQMKCDFLINRTEHGYEYCNEDHFYSEHHKQHRRNVCVFWCFFMQLSGE